MAALKPVAVLAGTRPEVIKLAPVVRALRELQVETKFVNVGQHRDMTRQTFVAVELKADYEAEAWQPGMSLNELCARLMTVCSRIVTDLAPSAVVVQGDTTTALCGALAACQERIPVGHVEAGLRTGVEDEPFPEEMNRRLITKLATWHFAPTQAALAHLREEPFHQPQCVWLTGNTVVDELRRHIERWSVSTDFLKLEQTIGNRKVVMVTLHRRESWDARLERLVEVVNDIGQDPDKMVIWPVHPNPWIVKATERLDRQKVAVVSPLAYPLFVALLARANLVLTDSGGVVEEAVTLGTPTMILRRVTERYESVMAGRAVMICSSGLDFLSEAVRSQLSDVPVAPYSATRMAREPWSAVFGDGRAGERIARVIAEKVAAAQARS